MSEPLDKLEIEISSSSTDAEEKVKGLADALERLKKSTTGVSNASSKSDIQKIGKDAEKSVKLPKKTIEQIEALSRATQSVNGKAGNALKHLAEGLRSLSTVREVKIPKSLSENIVNLAAAIDMVDERIVDKATKFSSSLGLLADAGKISISSNLPDRMLDIGAAMDLISDDAIRRLDSMTASLHRLSGVDLKGLPAALREVSKSNGSKDLDIAEGAGSGSDAKLSGTTDVPSQTVDNVAQRVGVLHRAVATVRQEFSLFNSDALKATKEGTASLDAMKKELFNNTTVWGKLKETARGTLDNIKTGLASAAVNSKTLSAMLKVAVPVFGTVLAGSKKLGKGVLNYITNPFKNALKAVNKWTSSIGRVAFYRLIRTAIKMVTEGFKEGIKNLYNFSSLTGTQFAPAMNQLATSSLYLKNSLGAIAAPLIQSIAPIVDMLVDKFVQLLNAINMVFSALGGSGTYTKAIKRASEYGDDLDKSMGGAAKSAKEFKRYLIGIDELTVIPDQDSPSGGGGSGSGINDEYGKMFEETQLPDWAKNIKDAIDAGQWYEAGELLADKVNEIIDKIDGEAWGSKLGEKIQNGIELGLGVLQNINWEDIGGEVAGFLNGLFDSVNPQDLGALLAQKIRIAIDFAYGFVTTFKWSEFGTWLSGVVNGWANEIDTVKLASTVSEAIKGALSAVSSFLQNTDFELLGKKIGQFLAELDWRGIFKEALTTIGDVAGSLKDTIVGIFEEADFSDILTVIGAILAIKLTPKLLSAIFHPFELMKNLAKMGGLSSGGEAASAIQSVTDSTSNVTLKLKDLATNLGWGIVIIGEVAIAAGLVVGAVWGLGALLDQVGQAWQPVIERGWVVAEDVLLGSAVLTVVGAAAYGLGTLGKTAALNIGVGTLILAELGVASGLFIAEIWGIGWGLDQVGQAWQPVLENGETIKKAIKKGSELLLAVGVVTAALGALTVGTVGALPIAIGVGTAMLGELTLATISFTDDLSAVADEMTNRLAPALSGFNDVLPGLTDDLDSFKTYMSKFAGAVVAYAGDSIVAGISGAVADIVTFFTGDPLADFTDEVNKTWTMLNGEGESGGLASLLTKTNPVLAGAVTKAENYVISMEELSSVITDYSGNETVSLIDSAVEKIKGWFKTDPLTKFKNEVNDTYKKLSGEDGLDAVLTKTVPVLTTTNTSATNFTTNLDALANNLNSYANTGTASGIADSVTTISGWFEDDPFGTLAGVVQSNYNALSGTSGVLGVGASEGLNSMLEKVIPELQTAYTSLSSYVGYLNLISDTTSGADFSGISDSIFVDMSGVGSNLVSGFTQGITDAGGVGAPVINGLNDMLTNINTYDWYTVGTNIGTGIVNGMYNIGQPLAAWGQAVLNKVQAMFSIHSPSRVFRDKVGYFLGTGIGAGIDDSRPEILSTISGLSADMQDQLAAASASMSAQAELAGYSANMNVRYENDSNTYAEYGADAMADVMKSNNEDLISVMYAVAQQVITAINEKDMIVNFNGRAVASDVTDMQSRTARRLGRSPAFV